MHPRPDSPATGHDADNARRRRAKYRRARVRHLLFTVGPNKLSGGRVMRRHIASDVHMNDVEIASPSWPRGLDGLRIAHVSDFHLGDLLPLDRALSVVDLIQSLAPDLVACTGDVIDLHLTQDAAALLQALARIDAPLGTALVLGNHDELHCSETLAGMAIEVGLLLLRDEAARITWNGQPLVVAGTSWAHSSVQCARGVERCCSADTHLLLSHNPRAFDCAARMGIPLTLAGHTHGGQIALKNRPAANLALGHRYTAGVFKQGPSRLYVTPGVGAWFPLRVNCPAEVAMITMRHQPADAANTAA